MTIRTVIEITGDGEYDFANKMRTTMENLGYVQRRDEAYGRFLADLLSALRDRDLNPHKLVEEHRAKLFARDAETVAQNLEGT